MSIGEYCYALMMVAQCKGVVLREIFACRPASFLRNGRRGRQYRRNGVWQGTGNASFL